MFCFKNRSPLRPDDPRGRTTPSPPLSLFVHGVFRMYCRTVCIDPRKWFVKHDTQVREETPGKAGGSKAKVTSETISKALEELDGRCATLRHEYWSYKWCHREEIIQVCWGRGLYKCCVPFVCCGGGEVLFWSGSFFLDSQVLYDISGFHHA